MHRFTLDRITQPLLAPDDPAAGGGGGGGGAGAGPEKPATIPYDRFQAVVGEKKILTEERDALKIEVQKLSEKAATVDTLSGQVNEWKQKAADAEGKFATFTEFSGALGTTDTDVISVFDAKYKALPEKDRPARADWIKSLREKTDEAPALLKPWLKPAEAAGGGGGAGAGAGGEKPKPKPVGGAGAGAGTGAALDQAKLRSLRQEAQRTGNFAPVEAYLKASGHRHGK